MARRTTVPVPTPAPDGLTISCGDCVMQHTRACDDCVVTYLCGADEGDAVVIDVEEARAMRLLAGAGLVPSLRHVRRTG